MLILVGVTVTVSLNGGLFEKAREGANKTQIEQEKEILTAAVIYAYNENTGEIDKDKLEEQLNDWNIEGEGPFTCTSPKENQYRVSNNGEVKYCLGTELEQYIFGEELKGRDIEEIMNDDNENVEFMYSLPDNENCYKVFAYIKYNNAIYRFKGEYDEEGTVATTMHGEGVTKIYEPTGKEGQSLEDVTGNSEYKDWIIIYDNKDTYEAVYKYAIGEVGLGAEYEKTDFTNDEDAKDEADLDNDNTVSEFEKAIYSYNHSIDIINNYSKNDLTGLPSNINVRSVGAGADTDKEYFTFENIKINEEDTNTITIKVRKPDMEYEADIARLMFHNIAKATIKGSVEETEYLVASRLSYRMDLYEDESHTYVYKSVQPYYYEGDLWRSGDNGLFMIVGNGNDSGAVIMDRFSLPVRPVIKVNKNS